MEQWAPGCSLQADPPATKGATAQRSATGTCVKHTGYCRIYMAQNMVWEEGRSRRGTARLTRGTMDGACHSAGGKQEGVKRMAETYVSCCCLGMSNTRLLHVTIAMRIAAGRGWRSMAGGAGRGNGWGNVHVGSCDLMTSSYSLCCCEFQNTAVVDPAARCHCALTQSNHTRRCQRSTGAQRSAAGTPCAGR